MWLGEVRLLLAGEIGRGAGCEDIDAPADYDDLQAAAEEGPIVYLGGQLVTAGI